MEEVIKEKYLKDYPVLITIEKIYKITEQIENCVCKILLKKGATGTGFFCKIHFINESYPVLITNYHVINDEYLENNKQIYYTINKNKEKNFIIKTNDRQIYLNEKYDTTIIEIKEEDCINNFLELDDDLFKENKEISYEGKTVYAIQYPKSDKVSVSFGILKEIKNCYDIIHLCSTDSGSSGSPILNLETNQVIGIHKEASCHFNYNKGTFLKIPINEYIIKINKIKFSYEPGPIRFLYTLKDDNLEYQYISYFNDYYFYNYNIYFGCWNEVLRCLGYIDEFFDYFKNNKFEIKNDSFLFLFNNIIDKMSANNNKYKFSEAIHFGKIFKQFYKENSAIRKIVVQSWLDPYELILFILDNLNEDLKMIKNNNGYNKTLNNEVINLQNKFSFRDSEKEKIIDDIKTIIGELFFGVEKIEEEKYSFNTLEHPTNILNKNQKVSNFLSMSVQHYQKYNNIYYDEYVKYLEENEMMNPMFKLSFDCKSYKGPKEKIDEKYNIILPPKIIINKGYYAQILDFNCCGYDYTLIGLIGYHRDNKYIKNIDNILKCSSFYHFYCICKDLKTNKLFKYENNQIIEINSFDEYKKNISINSSDSCRTLSLCLYRRIEKN